MKTNQYTEWTETTVDTNYVATYCDRIRNEFGVDNFIVVGDAKNMDTVTIVYATIVNG